MAPNHIIWMFDKVLTNFRHHSGQHRFAEALAKISQRYGRRDHNKAIEGVGGQLRVEFLGNAVCEVPFESAMRVGFSRNRVACVTHRLTRSRWSFCSEIAAWWEFNFESHSLNRQQLVPDPNSLEDARMSAVSDQDPGCAVSHGFAFCDLFRLQAILLYLGLIDPHQQMPACTDHSWHSPDATTHALNTVGRVNDRLLGRHFLRCGAAACVDLTVKPEGSGTNELPMTASALAGSRRS
jgi:hypothetical protein